jgi:hypothetical protein
MHPTPAIPSGSCDQYAAASLGSVERSVSMGLGTLLAVAAVRPRLMFDAGLLAAAGYLMYRGASGRCPLRERIDRRRAQSVTGADEFTALVEHGYRGPEFSRRSAQDPAVDEAAAESFPASDPPASTGSTAAPTQGSGAAPTPG